MTQSELKQAMTALHSECIKNATNFETPNFKQIIAKAVQLGMKYQEDVIKEGIDIIFKELHNKNIK